MSSARKSLKVDDDAETSQSKRDFQKAVRENLNTDEICKSKILIYNNKPPQTPEGKVILVMVI